MLETKLRKEDLQVGMVVTREQLSQVYGVYVYFKDYSPTCGGEIIHICNKPDEFVLNNIIKSGKVSSFYQDASYAEEDVDFYDE